MSVLVGVIVSTILSHLYSLADLDIREPLELDRGEGERGHCRIFTPSLHLPFQVFLLYMPRLYE